MRKIDVSHIKSALSAAKELACLQEDRRTRAMAASPAARDNADLVTSRQTLQHIAGSLIVKPGADIATFTRALEDSRRALDRIVDEERAAAIRRSSAEQDRLRSALERRGQALQALIDVDTTNSPRVLLNLPFLIWPTLGMFFDSSQIVPSNSSAKFRLDSSRSGYDEMSFYFLWDNPTDKFVVINVDGYLVLNGHCDVRSDGGFFADARSSSAIISANLHILEWWNQPPTSPPPQSDQSQQALQVSCSSGEMFSDGAHKSADVFRGYDLRHTLMLVPPHGVVVFEVAAGVLYGNQQGSVAVDFASGGFEVICPAVLVTILT